mmetsp:Transcript_63785/g.101082  ORF Transcript_63785/g.101082 Transcript_63785/m.101082 type:complete len:239 (-) Transcript_63785:220-936(-)
MVALTEDAVVEAKGNQQMEAVGTSWFWNRRPMGEGTAKCVSFQPVKKFSALRSKTKEGLPPIPAIDEIVEAVTLLTNDAEGEIRLDMDDCTGVFSPSFGIVQEDSHFEVVAMGSPIDLAYCDSPNSKFDFSSPQCFDATEQLPVTRQANVRSVLAEPNDTFSLAAEVSLHQEMSQSSQSASTERSDEDAETHSLEKKKHRAPARGKSRAAKQAGKSRIKRANQARVRDGDAQLANVEA